MADIKSTPAGVFIQRAYCDVCGEELEPEGMMLMTDPPQYPHKCTGCGAEEILQERYPKVSYREKDT